MDRQEPHFTVTFAGDLDGKAILYVIDSFSVVLSDDRYESCLISALFCGDKVAVKILGETIEPSTDLLDQLGILVVDVDLAAFKHNQVSIVEVKDTGGVFERVTSRAKPTLNNQVITKKNSETFKFEPGTEEIP